MTGSFPRRKLMITVKKIYKILAINPGSTTTKIVVFDNEKEIFARTLRHSLHDLQPYKRVVDQFEFRKRLIVDALSEAHIDIQSFSAVIGRGGLVKPIPSGVYEVNEMLKRDLTQSPRGDHASNLGGLLAADIAAMVPSAKAYIADPVVVDEFEDVARIIGHKLFRRVSIFHALNQKAVARGYACSIGKQYDDLNLIVAHLGGGISIGAHRHGRVIDTSNALEGEGPFSPGRSGSLPAKQLVDLCFSGNYTKQDIAQMINGQGGLVSLTGSNDVKELVNRALNGDHKIQRIIEAMAYNIGKEIGAMSAVLHGHVDAILITGGIAYNDFICDYIKEMVRFIAPVVVIPGENEMQALARSALAVLRGERKAKKYK